MGVLFDNRQNEWTGALDLITGQQFIDVRPLTVLLAALNSETVMELNGQTTFMIDARSAAFSGTLSIQGTIDGVNWYDIPVTNIVTQQTIINPVLSGATTNGWVGHCGGFYAVRTRVTAYTSGNIDVGMRATLAALRPSLERPYPTTLWVTATAAANTAVTATLPAAGVGLYHYITHIDIVRNSTAILAGTGTLIHTTTNLPGSPAWSVGNNMPVAGGQQQDVWLDFANPLKSSAANTATTVVCAAAGAAVLGRVNVGYFVGA